AASSRRPTSADKPSVVARSVAERGSLRGGASGWRNEAGADEATTPVSAGTIRPAAPLIAADHDAPVCDDGAPSGCAVFAVACASPTRSLNANSSDAADVFFPELFPEEALSAICAERSTAAPDALPRT